MGRDTIASLKRQIAGDSIQKRRLLEKLIRLVRADEAAKADDERKDAS